MPPRPSGRSDLPPGSEDIDKPFPTVASRLNNPPRSMQRAGSSTASAAAAAPGEGARTRYQSNPPAQAAGSPTPVGGRSRESSVSSAHSPAPTPEASPAPPSDTEMAPSREPSLLPDDFRPQTLILAGAASAVEEDAERICLALQHIGTWLSMHSCDANQPIHNTISFSVDRLMQQVTSNGWHNATHRMGDTSTMLDQLKLTLAPYILASDPVSDDEGSSSDTDREDRTVRRPAAQASRPPPAARTPVFARQDEDVVMQPEPALSAEEAKKAKDKAFTLVAHKLRKQPTVPYQRPAPQ